VRYRGLEGAGSSLHRREQKAIAIHREVLGSPRVLFALHPAPKAGSTFRPSAQARSHRLLCSTHPLPSAEHHRITESQHGWGLAGPSVDPQAQPPAEAGSPRAGCTVPRPGGSGTSPEETPHRGSGAWCCTMAGWTHQRATLPPARAANSPPCPGAAAQQQELKQQKSLPRLCLGYKDIFFLSMLWRRFTTKQLKHTRLNRDD